MDLSLLHMCQACSSGKDGAPGEQAESPKAPPGFRARPLLAPAGHSPVYPHRLRVDPTSPQRGPDAVIMAAKEPFRRTVHRWGSLPATVTLAPWGLSPSSSREPHAYDPGHQQPFSVQSNCFRQQHQTLSSECELCTCHLSGVICKKQMFEIIMHFSRNQGRFRLRGLLWETCIVLTESGRPLGSHT